MRSTELLSLALLFPSEFKRVESKPKVPAQGDFEAMARRRQRELKDIADDLEAGVIQPQEWAERFHATLIEGHSQAWLMGRHRAGLLTEAEEIDLLMGSAKADIEAQYLQGFLRDILDGRYTDKEGKLKIGPLVSRSNLYLGKMRGTANESFTAASGDDDEIWWVLGEKEHCSECPLLAADSPYTKHTLYTHPGAGDTPCRGYCDCTLRRGDGRTSFARVD